MTFVILTAGIDLSVGSIAGLSGVVAGYLIDQGLPLGTHVVFLPAVAVIVIAIVLGAGIGAVNGVLVAVIRIPAFIATLGMLYVARGAALLIAGGASFINLQGDPTKGNIGFDYVGNARWLNLPVMIYIMIIMGGIGAFIARRTVFGKHVYAVGGNERARRQRRYPGHPPPPSRSRSMRFRDYVPGSAASCWRRSSRRPIRPPPPIMNSGPSRPWFWGAPRFSAARAP